jgi:hypothetical protein
MSTYRNIIVFFGCQVCGACYRAVQARSSNIKPNVFLCEDCKSVVHAWSVCYAYIDWQRYENVEPANRSGPLQ